MDKKTLQNLTMYVLGVVGVPVFTLLHTLIARLEPGRFGYVCAIMVGGILLLFVSKTQQKNKDTDE